MNAPAVQMHQTGKLRLLRRREGSLADGLRARNPRAERALVGEHAAYVERLFVRILGRFADLDDLVQAVFIRALEKVDDLRDENVRSWLGAFTVNVAREALRKRRRRRWLVFLSSEELPDVVDSAASPEVHIAMRALYGILDRLDPDERVAFTLRVIDSLRVAERLRALLQPLAARHLDLGRRRGQHKQHVDQHRIDQHLRRRRRLLFLRHAQP